MTLGRRFVEPTAQLGHHVMDLRHVERRDQPLGEHARRSLALLADEVVVKRDLYVSVHEDIEFMGRMRAVTRFLSELFQREADYLNQF